MTTVTFAKGLKKYSFRTIEEELTYAWSSIYRYWWSALRCSRDYWWVCKEQGKSLDPDLNRVFKAFGDVHNRTFSDWWRYSARDNFREEFDPPKITQINSAQQLEGFQFDDEEWTLFKVPQGIKEAKLIEDFSKLLKKRTNRKSQITPTAAFPLNKHKNLQLDVYEKTFSVWLAVELSGDLKRVKTQDGLNFYDLGVKFNVNIQQVIQSPDDPYKQNKRNAMKVAVHRLLAKADTLIANAEIGIFPSEKPVEPRDRWKPSQLKRLEKAVLEGAWNPMLMSNNDWADELKRVNIEEQANRDDLDLFSNKRRSR